MTALKFQSFTKSTSRKFLTLLYFFSAEMLLRDDNLRASHFTGCEKTPRVRLNDQSSWSRYNYPRYKTNFDEMSNALENSNMQTFNSRFSRISEKLGKEKDYSRSVNLDFLILSSLKSFGFTSNLFLEVISFFRFGTSFPSNPSFPLFVCHSFFFFLLPLFQGGESDLPHVIKRL